MNQHVALFDLAIDKSKESLEALHLKKRFRWIKQIQIQVVAVFIHEIIRMVARQSISISSRVAMARDFARVHNGNCSIVFSRACLLTAKAQSVGHPYVCHRLSSIP